MILRPTQACHFNENFCPPCFFIIYSFIQGSSVPAILIFDFPPWPLEPLTLESFFLMGKHNNKDSHVGTGASTSRCPGSGYSHRTAFDPELFPWNNPGHRDEFHSKVHRRCSGIWEILPSNRKKASGRVRGQLGSIYSPGLTSPGESEKRGPSPYPLIGRAPFCKGRPSSPDSS